MRLLHRRLGELDTELETQIQELLTEQLDLLSEALLDFENVDDLRVWLGNLAE